MVYNFKSHDDTLQKALHSDYRITKIASMLLQSKFCITNFALEKIAFQLSDCKECQIYLS
jgi:hypothetical protein